MKRLTNNFLKYFFKIFNLKKKIFSKKWIHEIDKLRNFLITADSSKKLKILIGPSFSLLDACRALDRTIALGLELRGCEIIPIYCDSMQEAECNCVGGNWGGGDNWNRNCKKCRLSSEEMWKTFGNQVIKLSQFVNEKDRFEINILLESLTFESLLNFEYNNIDYGRLAKDILVNNYLVATPHLVPNGEILLKTHIKNLLQLTLCYRRIIQSIKPDRVISNDSYYGMWYVLENLCKEFKIPFYSHWPVSKNRIAIASNDAAMNLNFKKSWDLFSIIPLKEEDRQKIDNWLAGNRGLIIDTTKPSINSISDKTNLNIDKKKPTLLLAANVVWDLAALNKQVVFLNMNEWIIETIKWFKLRPEFQLIIKPHPVETAPSIPKTNETVESIIKSEFRALPQNIILLHSNSSMTSEEIRQMQNIKGVIVHTSTVGFEYPAHGFIAITTGRAPYRGFGFTIDPLTKDEYYSSLSSVLDSTEAILEESTVELARKFIKFYHFHYYSKIDAFEGNPISLSKDFNKVINSNEGAFSYILDKIISGREINDYEHWIPET
jgi:hypothetical protein